MNFSLALPTYTNYNFLTTDNEPGSMVSTNGVDVSSPIMLKIDCYTSVRQVVLP